MPQRPCRDDGGSLRYPLTIVRGSTPVVRLDLGGGRGSETNATSQPRLLEILAAREETGTMSAKRVSIGQVMMVVALAAVNLAVARTAPSGVALYPTLWVLLGSIDFLIIGKLILAPSLRAFHYTFLIVFVMAF